MKWFLLCLLVCLSCSSAADDKMGQASIVQKEALIVAKNNQSKGLRAYDKEIRRSKEIEFRLIFERELTALPNLTKADVLRLTDQMDQQRQVNNSILDAKLAQWLADPALDEAIAISDMTAAYARSNSELHAALSDLLKNKKAAAQAAAESRTS